MKATDAIQSGWPKKESLRIISCMAAAAAQHLYRRNEWFVNDLGCSAM